MISKQSVFVLAGALLGGLLGHLAFGWLVRQGFYGLVLPGGLVGLGAGIFVGRSRWLAGVCAALALAVGLYSEWRYFPFVADNSLSYFLCHLHMLRPVTLLMLVVGTFLGFWVPFRRVPANGAA
jgi:hypothetical protein